MQQRFCSCGHSIWVQYVLPNKYCWIVFRPSNHSNTHKLKTCPVCNKQLSIDDLY